LDTFSEEWVTVLGYGSLLSETSSRLTCPELTKFRLGRVSGFRRVFAQPASTFFKYGIALKDTLEFACVSAEYCTDGAGFVVSVFDIPAKKMLDGVPQRLLEREASYEVIEVDFQDFSKDQGVLSKGLLSVRSTDEVYIERWGQDRFNEQFLKYGIETLWGWSETSGIRPCPVYLRHCYLAAKSMGELCLNSFLDECCLIDRTTTIRQYLDEYPEVLLMEAPPELGLRYNG
jgi:cation transport regulator ChaC